MTFTYVNKTGSLAEFLKRVKSKELGVPDKITYEYLSSVGYTSSNDRPIVRVLKSIQFIDRSGVPTQAFNDFRTEKSEQVMAEALKLTYADLFMTFSEPLRKGREELENFFAKHRPSVKKPTLGLYVDTFKTLCEFADFKALPSETKEAEGEKAPPTEETKIPPQIPQIPQGITLNVNIQITLPVTDDAKVYENIFKALKENLLSTD